MKERKKDNLAVLGAAVQVQYLKILLGSWFFNISREKIAP